jgi:putative ABC transport system permease protein
MRVLWISLVIAWSALLLNKVRSILTLLGIIIGVGAVIAIVSLGEGLRADFQKQMSSLGADVLYMTPKAPKRPGQASRPARAFTMDDIEAIRSQVTSIAWVTPSARASVTARYHENTEQSNVVGVDEKYLEYSATAQIDEGRFFTRGELNGAARVAIIGDEIADDLFEPWEDPLGKVVKLNGVNYVLIGTFQHYTGMINEGGNINKGFVAPLSTVQRRLIGSDDVYWVTMFLKPHVGILTAKEEIATLMRQRRRIRNVSDDDFQFISPDDFMEMGNQFINVMIGIFGAIAFISLLVGGVGIMNIMLVSVTERTREIGLRMAVGAGRPTVLSQFLVESIALTLSGGLIGLGIGYAGAWAVSALLRQSIGGNWNPHIPALWVCYAVGVSVLIGVLFGTYPAYKASQLDPVEAMRYE